ncbi:hypothetical protein EM89_010320 [Vibrio parahaemolyticus]|nr:hypothetical protein AGE71_16415 [Vibrio parahaemolyticus]OQS79644.1 hypothetical protein EM89_010320 [Vibrio parahaemolyticus]OQT01180.1 hypothetical protein EN04_004640 [Vibrio parahaemolyticus O4:K12 str. K1203]
MRILLSKIKTKLSHQFDPHSSFITLPIVWQVTSLLVGTSTFISVVIICNTPIAWDFSADGFNYFISTFRFPIAILALIIPIIALLAANHRSEQTKEQIRAANQQNIFTNYYKHLEEFKKYVDTLKIPSVTDIEIRKLHRELFPDALDGNLSPNINLAHEFAQCCEKALDAFNSGANDVHVTLALAETNYIFNKFHLTKNPNLPQMNRVAALTHAEMQLSKVYAIFMFSHIHYDFVDISYSRYMAQVDNDTYMKMAS